jgi:hypothetical protein
MEPIVLFTGHGCRSETDENSEDELDDAVVTNPNYFKHIKHVVKPHAATPTEQVAKGWETSTSGKVRISLTLEN